MWTAERVTEVQDVLGRNGWERLAVQFGDANAVRNAKNANHWGWKDKAPIFTDPVAGARPRGVTVVASELCEEGVQERSLQQITTGVCHVSWSTTGCATDIQIATSLHALLTRYSSGQG